VTRQFTIWYGFGRLLQLQQLVVYASAFLWNYEERIHRALRTSSLIAVTSQLTDIHIALHTISSPQLIMLFIIIIIIIIIIKLL